MTKTAEETACAASQYMAFHKGWSAGAASREQDPLVAEHTDEKIRLAYVEGYLSGQLARAAALTKAAGKYKHRPTPLREKDPCSVV